MKILISSFMTPQSSHRFSFFHKVVGNFTYFVASDLCENFPYDLNIAALKNKCIRAARINQPDWLVLLSGIDCSIKSLPNFRLLNEDVLYLGHKIEYNNPPQGAANWILSKKIYNNYLLDEEFSCYGWDDYDFVYNVCKDFKKIGLHDFITVDLDPDNVKLVCNNEFAKTICQQNGERFKKKYFDLYGRNFDFGI